MLKKLTAKSASKSPWIYPINTGSCNGCDIELVSVVTPRYDVERMGFKLIGTPRHADIVVISGPITAQSKERLVRTLAQVPEPRVIVSLGSCPNSGNVFKNSYSLDGPLDKYGKVDVIVAGCPPKPEAIIDGLASAALTLKKKMEELNK